MTAMTSTVYQTGAPRWAGGSVNGDQSMTGRASVMVSQLSQAKLPESTSTTG